MSSRSQTKSLDRELYQRKKKVHYPQNIQKVIDAAEHLICHYHNQIEDIFSHYPVKEFLDNISSDEVSIVIDNLPTVFNLDGEVENVFRQMTYVSNEVLSKYLDFVIATQQLLVGINSKLVQSIVCGLIRYCVSFANYCISEISFVINYERIIQRNLPDISKELKDIEKEMETFAKVTMTTREVLKHGVEVVTCVGKIRASINKLYYLVTEWVDEERSYKTNLGEEMKSIKAQIFAIQQRSDASQELLSRRQARLASLEKHIDILQKNKSVLKKKHRRIRRSKQNIEDMLNDLENEAEIKDKELVLMNRRLNQLENSKSTSNKKNIQMMKSEQRELMTKYYRLDDSKIALGRHRDRLSKADLDICEKIEDVDREIRINENTRNKLLNGLKEDTEQQASDVQMLNELHPVMSDLNFLYSKKNSPETLRQLCHHGRLITETKEINPIDKMCERVSVVVPESWRELYLNLPIYPSRSKDQRSSDIEVIDLLSARNNNTPTKQAKMCLNKWRLFYHNATPSHLIEGLKKSRLLDIAKEIEDLDIKSKRRYEDD